MTVTSHPLADDYLRRLGRAARVLPRHEREELVAEIRSHLDSGLARGASEADVRNLLDDLGPPGEIVAAARPEQVPVRRGAREVFALILLVTGLPPVFGWFLGLGLLLWSPLWSARQKLLGILVWPGGLPLFLLLVASRITEHSGSCWAVTNSSGGITEGCENSGLPEPVRAAVTIFFVVAPLLVAAYLYRAAGKGAQPL